MANSSRRGFITAIIVAAVLLLILWLARCSRPAPRPTVAQSVAPTAASVPPPVAKPADQPAAEVLTPATLRAPAQIAAGAAFRVEWTGPDNRGDFITIVAHGTPEDQYATYAETKAANPLTLTAPMEPGAWELRYLTNRSHTVLGRAAIAVLPVAATLEANAEAVQGTQVQVAWTGPNNAGDFITVVAASATDGTYENYFFTKAGSPTTLTLPITPGDMELRYMSGQGYKVLGRRPLKITAAGVTLAAAGEAVAGTSVSVAWTGPNNPGDYITLVPKATAEGQYGNYSDTSKGSPLVVTAPIETGDMELRYMTGQGAKVLARRPLTITAAPVSLSAPDDAVAGSVVRVAWTGPNNPGDYVTFVPQAAADGQYENYTYTTQGSPLSITAPIVPGAFEVRYMTGQGAKVLARRPITFIAVKVSLSAPAEAVAGQPIPIVWTGPNYPGDFVTVVPIATLEGQFEGYADTTQGSPVNVTAPKESGAAEVRYVSGQGRKTLGRQAIRILSGSGKP